MKNLKTASLFFLSIFILNGCKKEKKDNPTPSDHSIPEFYKSSEKLMPSFTTIANFTSNIASPQDLDFNPSRPNELWIINKGSESTGGSTVMITEVGTPNQKIDYRKDGNALHFMSLPSAIAFGINGNWATSASVLDANHQGGSFTGPTLWSSDLNIYAKYAGPGTNGSHLDMLHGSPYSMGIAYEKNNIYWVFDGYHQHIVRYDFGSDHGPGNSDHSDGKIHRYTEVQVTKNKDVPSHMVLDQNQKWLYLIDGGSKKILRMDITSGNKYKNLATVNEPLAENWEMENVTWEYFMPESFVLDKPCGLDIKDNRLFISDYATGEIICVDINDRIEIGRINTGTPGIMGIKIGTDGNIWYVNADKNILGKVEPK